MGPTLRTVAPSFARHLAATNRSPRTIRTYMAAVEALTLFLDARMLRADVRGIDKPAAQSAPHVRAREA